MRRRPLPLLVAAALLGFLLVTAIRSTPSPDPASRVPRRFQLAALIEREEARARRLRDDVARLRADVARRSEPAAGSPQAAAAGPALAEARLAAGLRAVRGPGLRIVLDDSDLAESPTGDVADLVIHSQDVQAVVNAVWRAGAEAVAINGERLVSTSAVLCVGNTLLLNGTVHSPPFEIVAVAASRQRFRSDALVDRLHDDASAFGLRFSVAALPDVRVPAYRGLTTMRYAAPAA